MPKPFGRRDLWKLHSKSQITWAARRLGSISRTQLAKILGISPTWLGRIVDELIREGVLIEAGAVSGRRGRPRILLTINPEFALVAGVWFAPESAEIAVANSAARIMARKSVSYGRIDGRAEQTLAAIGRGIHRCAESAGRDPATLSGIGVSVAGSVDTSLGTITGMRNRPEWEGVQIARLLSRQIGVSVDIENDIRAGALASDWFGNGIDRSSALYVYVGAGIGAAIVDERGLLSGAHNAAGRIEFTVIDCDPSQSETNGGRSLEDVASDIAFIRSIRRLGDLKVAEVTVAQRVEMVQRGYEMAKSGDIEAAAALKRLAHYLSVAIANAVSVLDPSVVFLCGTLIDIASDEIAGLIKREVLAYVDVDARSVEIRPLPDYESFMLQGAIGVALRQPYSQMNSQALRLFAG